MYVFILLEMLLTDALWFSAFILFLFLYRMFNTHSFGPSPNYIIMICIYAYDMIQDMIL